MSGAGIAALRIHRALSDGDFCPALHVLRKRTDAPDVHAIGGAWTRRGQALRARTARAVFAALGSGPDVMLSANMFPTGMHLRLNDMDVDLLHLHWVGNETIRIEELARLSKPVVWTLHDEWFYGGIDHYRPIDGSGNAATPFVSRARLVLDRSVRSRKAASWKQLDPLVVAPSRWLAQNAALSGLLPQDRIRVIPNPIPLDTYRPIDRAQARKALGLPQDHRIIGFGAVRAGMDPRKGFALLVEALHCLATMSVAPTTLLVFGAERSGDALPLPAHFTGTVSADADLARLYAAMDVFVCPSLQENFPNTIGEAMACGIPCAAFGVGGIPEMIEHEVNGYLAVPRDPNDLARGIDACLAGGEILGRAARTFAEANLDPAVSASKYAAVYAEALRAGRSGTHRA
jgi:glycosyltransferase involved in cell wall biosynthesis